MIVFECTKQVFLISVRVRLTHFVTVAVSTKLEDGLYRP
jgi:hypothetical protein